MVTDGASARSAAQMVLSRDSGGRDAPLHVEEAEGRQRVDGRVRASCAASVCVYVERRFEVVKMSKSRLYGEGGQYWEYFGGSDVNGALGRTEG
jgi:hypothetical protein